MESARWGNLNNFEGMSFYFDVLKAFYQEEVKYLIVGGTAVNLHGVPRITNDLDVLISFDKENLEKAGRVMKKLGYVPRLPGVKAGDLADKKKLDDWIQHRNLKVFSYFQPSAQFRHVDILLVQPLNFEEAFKNKVVTSFEGVEFNIVSLQDLIKMKEFSGREHDLSDIELLKTIKEIRKNEK